MAFVIRPIRIEDVPEVHRLSWQLGYEPTLDLVRENVARMLEHPDYQLVGICEGDGPILGWMSLAVRIKIEDVSHLQVAALVTDETRRGSGLGRRLMDHAADVARSKRLAFIGLHSSKRRVEAHAFYEHIGYAKAKESFYFRKDMA